MKRFALFAASLLLMGTAAIAKTTNTKSENKNVNSIVRGYGNSFIFLEGGIEFSVFPDGQFDFYMPNYGPNVSVGISTPNATFSFNSGYDYSPYVQYDDFGAIIQIENTPIFYDYYGRIVGAGNVNITYNNVGYVQRVGGLHVIYRGNVFSHCTGFINTYNRHYVYRPWHRYYAIPVVEYRVVYARPYRQYYQPVRYTYYAPYRDNYRSKIRYDYGRNNVVYRDGRRTVGSRISERYNQRSAQRVASSSRNDLRSSANPRGSYNTADRNSSRVRNSDTRIRDNSGSRIANRASDKRTSRDRISPTSQNKTLNEQRISRRPNVQNSTASQRNSIGQRSERTVTRNNTPNRAISNQNNRIARSGESRQIQNTRTQQRTPDKITRKSSSNRNVQRSTRPNVQNRTQSPSRNKVQSMNRRETSPSSGRTSRSRSRGNNE